MGAGFYWKTGSFFLLCVLSPALIGFALQGGERVFTGLSGLAQADYFSYLAWAKQAQEGRWLLRNLYTPGADQATLWHPLFLAVGRTARALHWPLPWAVMIWRVVVGVAFLVMAYRWVFFALTDEAERRVGWLLFLFASGAGGAMALLGFISPENAWYPTDLEVPEQNAFLTMLHGFPLHALSQVLMVQGLLCAWHVVQKRQPGALLGMCAALFLLAWVHPYDLVLVFALLIFLAWLYRRNLACAGVLMLGVVAVLSVLPAAIHHLVNLQSNPSVSAWIETKKQSAPPVAYLLGLLPFLVLAFLSKPDRSSQWFCTGWVFWSLLLVFSPLSFQRVMINGIHFPLAALAAPGLLRLTGGSLRAARVTVILLSFSNIVMMTTEWKHVQTRRYPFFLDAGRRRAFAFLDQAPPGVLLGVYATGNVAPAYTGQPVYVGHWDQTVGFAKRKQEAEHFFARGKPPFGFDQVSYIFYGPEERAVNPRFQPPAGWVSVLSHGGVVVYHRVSAASKPSSSDTFAEGKFAP